MIRLEWGRLRRTALGRRCPACGRGELFREGYRLHDRCPDCGVDLQGAHGAHYGGPIVLGYAAGGVAGLAALAALGALFGLRAWVIWAAVAAVVVAVLASYRTCKAAWVWFLYATDEIGEEGEWRER